MNDKAKVLISDRRAPLTLWLKDIVEKAGFEAVVAYSGQVALSQTRAMLPDLVVLSDDIGPPGPSETARRIKEDPATATIPIVILATTPEETEALAGSYPVEACLPVTTDPGHLTNVFRLLAGGSTRRSKNGQTSVGPLEGTLQGNLLPELLEFLFVTKKAGRVTVSDGERHGAIYFDDGNVLHAEFDDVRGRDAFFRACFLGHGYFKFEPGVRASETTLLQGGVGLLLEAAKQLDDRRRVHEADSRAPAVRIPANRQRASSARLALAKTPNPPPQRAPVMEPDPDLEFIPRTPGAPSPPVSPARAQPDWRPEPLAASTDPGSISASARFRPAVTTETGPHLPLPRRSKMRAAGAWIWSAVILLGSAGALVAAFFLGRYFPAPAVEEPAGQEASAGELPWEGARHDVSIDSEPEGARVTIDGHDVGFTPVAGMSLKPGSYLIRLQRDGWEPLQRDVVVTADEASHRLSFTLQPVVATGEATLILRVVPAGAAVFVNGQKLAPSPSPPKFQPGSYRVEVKAKDFESWSGQVELAAGATRELAVQLRRLTSPLESEPPPPEAEAESSPEADLPIIEPVKISGDSPSYPKEARDRRIKGSVLVDIEVDERGQVASVRVLESAGDVLDDAVVAAIRTWKFEPATQGGSPVRAFVKWRHSFR